MRLQIFFIFYLGADLVNPGGYWRPQLWDLTSALLWQTEDEVVGCGKVLKVIRCAGLAANYVDIKGPTEPDLPERHEHDEGEDFRGHPPKKSTSRTTSPLRKRRK